MSKAGPIIQSILEEMYSVAKRGDIKSPDWWIDKAVQLNALRQNLEDELTLMEMAYENELHDLISAGAKANAAKTEVRAKSENWKMYKHLEARSKIVSEAINLAKKRERLP